MQGKRKKTAKRDTWPVKAFFLTFALALAFSFLSETTLLGVSLPIAVAVLFLADPENSYTNGHVIAVDGGWTAGYAREF